MAFLPFGCGGAIEYPPLKQVSFIEARHAPNKTIARLRECVDEYGGRLRGGGFEFNYTVDVDEWGGAASVKSDVFHADFDGCTRAALRAIQFDPEVLLTWISDTFAQGEGQTNAARGLVGNLVVAGVRIVLAPILIEAAGVYRGGDRGDSEEATAEGSLPRCGCGWSIYVEGVLQLSSL